MRLALTQFVPTFRARSVAVGLWLVGCANLLGVEDGVVQDACTSKAQCAPGYECLLGICRDDCTGDEQCGAGARCLRAIGTSACIPVSEACGEMCPTGTLCTGGSCRTECENDADCSGGQDCQRGLCVGQDPMHDTGLTPAGGSPNAGSSGATSGGRGGALEGGGAAGAMGGEGALSSAGDAGGGTGPLSNDAGAGGEPPGPKSCSPACEGATPVCDAGECKAPKSCEGAPSSCGPLAASKCCEPGGVPGGSVLRSYDGVTDDAKDDSNPANVGKFSLDLLEVTVGRFRRFVAAGGGVKDTAPEIGAGAVKGSAASGWKSEYTDGLVADKNALVTALGCHQFSTWTNTPDTVGTGETRPIDCVTWYEAQAFCIWDGGRLPTEAEWNYVAAGSQQRVYPWSVPANKVEATCAQASFYLNDTVKCCAFTETPAACSAADIVVAGSKSGKGFWGHRDLGGNVQEWVADYYAPNYQNPCDDCVQTNASAYRVLRGGGYFSGPTGLTASARDGKEPFSRAPDIGFRCAYAP